VGERLDEHGTHGERRYREPHGHEPALGGAEHDEAFQQFLGSRPVRLAFLEHRDRARALLRRYLEQLGFFGHRSVAFVDVGWKGSMQDNIVRAFADDPGCPEVHGLYLGFLDHGLPQQPRSTKHGYLADSRRGDPEEYDFFRNTPVVEMATTAAHGSAVGYRPGGGDPRGSVPVLRHHDIEKALAEGHFLAVQEAIYAYGRELARVRPLLPFTAEELRPGVLDAFLRYVRYPTREEAAEFLRFSHVESFGVDEVTTFGLDIDRRLLLRPWRAIPELSRALDRNLWREGVVRRSGIPMANFAYDLYRTLRGR